MVVWKYAVTPLQSTVVEFPSQFKILHFGLDGQEMLCIWALVDPNSKATESRRISVIGTGNGEAGPHDHYIGSVTSGPFVWHAFAYEK